MPKEAGVGIDNEFSEHRHLRLMLCKGFKDYMDNLTKRYAISKDASEVINLLRLLSIVFVVLIHNTPAVPSRIIFSSGMGQWFYGLMRHTILDPPIYVFS